MRDLPAMIHLRPEKIWGFYERNKERLCREMVLIAENDSTNTKIYLSSENTLPYIYAVVDGKEVAKEGMVTMLDASDTAYSYYFRYLTKPAENIPDPDDADCPPEPDDDEELTPQDALDEIYEREDALFFALRDFLQVVLEADESDFRGHDDLMDQILDDILTLLSERYACKIYRPTVMEDKKTGLEYIENYPYSS